MAKSATSYTLQSYALDGIKESFANWVSNLSPIDTPFVSLTGKEAISNSIFQWQEDKLAVVNLDNAVEEGSQAADVVLTGTDVINNRTQILRKVVKVSDTANALANYGRGQELQYQMEKAGKEIKRDLEVILLNAQVQVRGDAGTGATSGTAPTTATFPTMVSKDPSNGSTGAIIEAPELAGNPAGFRSTVIDSATNGQFDFDELDQLLANLYTVGASCNTIMFHPSYAKIFSGLEEGFYTGTFGDGSTKKLNITTRQRLFDGASDTKVNTYVATYVDPLGQEFKLVPNRFMPKGKVYVFSPSDWTQMVLRAPERKQLAKDGSYEKWMIEMEVGLRHRHKHASGIYNVVH